MKEKTSIDVKDIVDEDDEVEGELRPDFRAEILKSSIFSRFAGGGNWNEDRTKNESNCTDIASECEFTLKQGNKSVLSLQSWVSHGYVGNRCASIILPFLGTEVDCINTVSFSNHTGFPYCGGEIHNGDSIWKIYEALVKNKIVANYSHFLTGYMGSSSSTRIIGRILKSLKKNNPSLVYVCDPVLGDCGKLYVPEELVSIYEEDIIPEADILLPNQTELSFLSGIEVNNMTDVRNAVDRLHRLGSKAVVVTSLMFDDGQFKLFGSVVNQDSMNKCKGDSTVLEVHQFVVKIPDLLHQFTGAGDLFSSAFVGYLGNFNVFSFEQDIKSLMLACERAVELTFTFLKHSLVLAISSDPWRKETHQDSSNPNQNSYSIRMVECLHYVKNLRSYHYQT